MDDQGTGGADGFVSHVLPANGTRIHYVTTGRGPTLFLLHGWPEFWLTMRPLAERLRDRFTLVMPDLRGFGRTPNPVRGPTDEEGAALLARDVLALQDALGLERAGFVAHDVSAYVMQSFARSSPDRVEKLFFFNCPTPGVGDRWIAHGHVLETWYQYFNQTPMAAELVTSSRDACRIFIHWFLTHWAHQQHAFDEDLEAWVDNFMAPGVMQGGFDWYRAGQKGRQESIDGTSPTLPRIDLPTRVLWGRNDIVNTPDWTDALHGTFSDVRIGFAEDAGHFVHREQPDVAAAAITEFFAAAP